MKLYTWLASALATLILVGCSNTTDTNSDRTIADGAIETEQEHGDHSHGEAPHGGTICDWGGGKFHVEFTVDHNKQEATVYVLGSDAKSPAPIAATTINLAIQDPQLRTVLNAKPLDGDAEGMSSRFVGNHEGLGVVKEYEGTIFGTVDGKPYSGDFTEVAHDH